MPNKQIVTYAQAVRDAMRVALARDPSVLLIGEGVPDPKGIFGTTLGLQKEFGATRVFDMPVSEAGVTGVCIGAAISGLRPVMTHQRVDFSLLAFEQIVNTAAKWYNMFGGQVSVPLVTRMIIGRGWGQGSQHSQSLQALYAHIPGLKVIMPASAYDAKGLLLAAIADSNPVMFIEHRWLHGIAGSVPNGYYTVPIGQARVVEKGKDLTVVASSYMTVESLKATAIVREAGISIDLIDLRSIKPLDTKTILQSVKKTGRLLVADTGYRSFGVAAEILALVAEAGVVLRSPPVRITLPDAPTPTSWKLAEGYYPSEQGIAAEILEMMEIKKPVATKILKKHEHRLGTRSDVPDPSFTGPF